MNRSRVVVALVLALALLVPASFATAQTTTTTAPATTTTTSSVPPYSGTCTAATPCLVQHDTYANQGGVQSYKTYDCGPCTISPLPFGYAGSIYDMVNSQDVWGEELFANNSDYPFHVVGITGYQPGGGATTPLRIRQGPSCTTYFSGTDTTCDVAMDDSPTGILATGVPEFHQIASAAVYTDGYGTDPDGKPMPVWFDIPMSAVIPPHTYYTVGARGAFLGANNGDTYDHTAQQKGIRRAPVISSVALGGYEPGSYMHGLKGYLADVSTGPTTTSTFPAPGGTQPPGTAIPAPTGEAPPGGPPSGACDGFWCAITGIGGAIANMATAIVNALWSVAKNIVAALGTLLAKLGEIATALGALASGIASALSSVLSTLFQPSSGKFQGLIDPITSTTFLGSLVQLAGLPASMVAAAQASVGSPCPAEFTFSGHSFGLCQSLATVEASGDWSTIRAVVLGGLIFLLVVALYRRLTDRMAS